MYSSISENKNTIRLLSVSSINFQVCYYGSTKSGPSSSSSANLNYLSISTFKPNDDMPRFTPLIYNCFKL